MKGERGAETHTHTEREREREQKESLWLARELAQTNCRISSLAFLWSIARKRSIRKMPFRGKGRDLFFGIL